MNRQNRQIVLSPFFHPLRVKELISYNVVFIVLILIYIYSFTLSPLCLRETHMYARGGGVKELTHIRYYLPNWQFVGAGTSHAVIHSLLPAWRIFKPLLHAHFYRKGIAMKSSNYPLTGTLKSCEAKTTNQTTTDSVIDKKLAQIPKSYHSLYLRAMNGKSRASAIKAFCLECVGWERNEVKMCTEPDCPLYPYRPFQNERKLK